jgi:ATP-dependent Lhr-like helicase
MARRWMAPESAADLGRLDPEAIARVRTEAWPDPVNAEELHDALLWLGCLNEDEVSAAPEWRGWLAALAQDNRVGRLRIPQATLWVAAERGSQFQGLPDNTDALADILRGRLEGLGPVTQAALAAPLGLEADDISAALVALEVEGFALRGHFTPGSNAGEWCDRRLLARIHHYTVRRLRAEIEPVAARDFLRFLFDWHRVTPETRLEGPDAVSAAVSLLEGYEAAAGAWETEILPARIIGYEPTWLDDMCLAGRVAWGRLTPGIRASGPVRTTPIALLIRRHAAFWSSLASFNADVQPNGRTQAVLDCLRVQGALFFEELAEASGLLRPQLEEALGELVSLGLVTSDSFGGLRALLVPSDRRKPFAGGTRRRRIIGFGMEDAGRWSLMRRPASDPQTQASATEFVARALLRRYGVVFWRLLAREADWLPPWRDLLRVYRRLEACGEIRGGRFVAGFAGEQYALPDAIGLLREVRRRPLADAFVSLSGADPLNLVGILTPGAKLAAVTANRLLYCDGLPVASLSGGAVQFLTTLDTAAQWQARKMLLRSASPALLADLG